MSRILYNEHYFVGRRFGSLIATNFRKVKRWNQWKSYSLCNCDCGSTIDTDCQSLRIGRTKSCGCQKNPQREKHHSYKGCGEISSVFFTRMKNNAKRRKHKFQVTIKELWELFLTQDKKCAITKQPIKFHSSNVTRDGNASLDRIDSSKDYVTGNVQWVSREINFMKQSLSQKRFIELCKMVVSAQGLIG